MRERRGGWTQGKERQRGDHSERQRVNREVMRWSQGGRIREFL